MLRSRSLVLALATAAATFGIVTAGAPPATALREDIAPPRIDPVPVVNPKRLSSTPFGAATKTEKIPDPGGSAGIAVPTALVPSAPATTTCLTKEYLASGFVLFRDVCTNEMAMHSYTVAPRVVRVMTRACLSKETLPNGVVLFRDICSEEWAMSPAEEQG
jgi:hypothetical protein